MDQIDRTYGSDFSDDSGDEFDAGACETELSELFINKLKLKQQVSNFCNSDS